MTTFLWSSGLVFMEQVFMEFIMEQVFYRANIYGSMA